MAFGTNALSYGDIKVKSLKSKAWGCSLILSFLFVFLAKAFPSLSRRDMTGSVLTHRQEHLNATHCIVHILSFAYVCTALPTEVPTKMKINRTNPTKPLTLGLMLSWICKIHCAKERGNMPLEWYSIMRTMRIGYTCMDLIPLFF